MLLLILEAAVRSTVLLLVVLLALKVLRARNPHILMAAWQMVLAASLLMPLLVGWVRFAVVPRGLPMPDISSIDFAALVAPAPPQALSDIESASIDDQFSRVASSIDWLPVFSIIYALVAGCLMLRWLAGCALMWRLCRAALPVRENWASGWDVRTHPSIAVPATFGSTILLPLGCSNWDAIQRRAVLAHEYAHVRRADFYVLALASINRAVFWFNPLAWWLHRRIADLAEARSDVAAIQDIEDRARYAEILLHFASRGRRSAVSLAMAQAKTLGQRVERILGETIMPKRMDRKAWAVVAACILPLAAVAAGAVLAQVPAQGQQQIIEPVDPVLVRKLEQARRRTEVFVDPKLLDNYVGYYQLDQFKVFTTTRLGDRLYIQLTGQEFLPLYPESTQKFFYKGIKVPAQISFATDAQSGRAIGLTLHQSGVERFAKRVEEVVAKAVQEGWAKRLKEPTPMPGSEAALKRQILAFQQGQPAYHEMSEALASATRPQVPRIERTLARLGPLQSVSFRGVGLGGRDVYEAKFENGMAICRIYMADDGKVAWLLIQWGP